MAEGVAEQAKKAQQVTWAFDGLVRTRVKWLAERIISFQPSAVEIMKFQIAYWRYRLLEDEITGWSKDDNRTDAAFDESWDKEYAARSELIKQVNLLADMEHPPQPPQRGQSGRPAGGRRYDLLGGPDPLERS